MRDPAEQYPKAFKYLMAWVKTVRAAAWRSLVDGRACYEGADMVQVARRNQVLVFLVCGNAGRLMLAMPFDRQTAFPFRFRTHAEYGPDTWKDEL